MSHNRCTECLPIAWNLKNGINGFGASFAIDKYLQNINVKEKEANMAYVKD